MSAKVSARLVAIILAGIVIFQLAAMSGAAVGAYTQGGQHPGTLDTNGRAVAFISAIMLTAMALGVLALVGEGPLRNMTPSTIRTLANVTAIYMALSVFLNVITKSSQERAIFWPISVFAFLLTFNTLLKTPKQ